MPSLAPTSAPDTRTSAPPRQSVWLGVLAGQIPLALLASLDVLAVVVTMLAHARTTGEAFLTQQPGRAPWPNTGPEPPADLHHHTCVTVEADSYFRHILCLV